MSALDTLLDLTHDAGWHATWTELPSGAWLVRVTGAPTTIVGTGPDLATAAEKAVNKLYNPEGNAAWRRKEEA